MQLAGGGQRPSVSLTTDFQLGGPSLIMRGIGDHQTILLGFPAEDTIAPTQPGSNWGLLFPGRRAHEQFAGIGVSRNPASNILKGFVFPIGRQVGTQ